MLSKQFKEAVTCFATQMFELFSSKNDQHVDLSIMGLENLFFIWRKSFEVLL